MNIALRRTISNNSSIVIMASGAGSLFLLNLILKKNLTAIEFGYFGLLITYISVVNSFGLLGVDQLIIRKSKIHQNNDKLFLNSSNSTLLLFSIVLSSAFALFSISLNLFPSFVPLILINLFTILLMLFYNIFRITRNYKTAQFASNLWKLSLLICLTIIIYSSQDLSFQFLQNSIVILLGLSVILFLPKVSSIVHLSKISLKRIERSDLLLCGYFFLSLLTLSFISQGDRFLMEILFEDIGAVGNYIYISTLVVFPFIFLQNYLGFKFLGEFKYSSNPLNLLRKKIKIATLLGVGLVLFVISLIYFLINFGIVEKKIFLENLPLLIIFLFTGLIRLYYSIFSSLMGALGSLERIKKANLQTLLVIILIIPLSIPFLENSNSVALLFLVFWMFRAFFWYSQVKKDEYENSL